MILFLSNGSGEDSVAALIAQALPPGLECAAVPLLGAGAAYAERVRRLVSWEPPPSLGLSNESWRLWLRDLRHGLAARVLAQGRFLRRLRPRLTVVVGDLFPLSLAGLSGLGPCCFVGTAKSSHHHPYSWLERLGMRRWARHSFVRDARTAAELRVHGLSASWVGNVMMDELRVQEPLQLAAPGLALLPGSRTATYAELPRMLEVLRSLRTPVEGLVAVAPAVDVQRLADVCPGWTLRGQQLERAGVLPVRLLRDRLGDVLAAATVCLGQAGTANEQAAGAGVPVVALGHARGWYRKRQQGLLGGALEVVPEHRAVDALERLLADPDERERRARIGRERLGPPGGAAAIASWIAENRS